MDDTQLQALANELAKNLKTPEDLSQFDRLLKKISVEAALNAELTHHLGHEKNQTKSGTNFRNGYSTKTVTTTDGPMELRTPPDRDGSFEPQLVKKNQTRITGMDNQIPGAVCQRDDYPRNYLSLQRNVRRRCLAHADIQSDRCG